MSTTNGSMKVFRASERASTPLQFGVECVRLDGTRQVHKFIAPGQLPMGALRFVTGALGDANEDGTFALRLTDAAAGLDMIFGLFAKMLPSAEYDRFEALANDPESVIEMETLAEIIGWLIEEYTGRPTVPPSSSGDGRQSTSPSSTETSSPEDSTSSTSPSPAI